MKTILYSTDLSKKAVPVLQFAHKLSQKLEANLVVFHIHQLPPTRISVSRPIEQLKKGDS